MYTGLNTDSIYYISVNKQINMYIYKKYENEFIVYII